MKATINGHGHLYVEGETPLEDYALRKWYENWGDGKDSIFYVCLPNNDGKSVAPTIVRPMPKAEK